MDAEQIFSVARGMDDPQVRSAFIAGACQGDEGKRVEVEGLLAGRGSDPGETVEAAPLSEAPGTVIGRYKILEKIGEGGMAVVYVAEQHHPIRRRVALKIIKPGMDTKQVIGRFEAERQALALMDHPNIARVLDGGTTDVGRPYFVMELVHGIPITHYCDQEKLCTRDRLDLFIQVCHAIQHAHQKGIIHRDIKPSNVMVTLHDGVPVPKVIDFGIAKAAQQDLTDKTVYTQVQQFVGTPAYTSPEQAEMSGLDIDTRSDIYSLGVLLYELLTGFTPLDTHELMQSGLDQMRKIIREREPNRPSTKLGTLSAEDRTTTALRRSTEVPKLISVLRGDLDWIVMKCLEKDRTRRYETANGVAADLKRHLAHEPIVARPPSSLYRFEKMVRRNKIMACAVVAVLLSILAGTTVSITEAWRARKEMRRALVAEAKALEEKSNAQAALHFIQDDVLNQASPGNEPDRDLRVRDLLDRVAQKLDDGTRRPPLVEAALRQTIGSIYTELGVYSKALQHYEAALTLQRQHLGESHPDTLRSLCGLAMAHWWSGDMAQAEPLTRQGLEESRRVLGEKDPLTLRFMQARAFVLMATGEMPWSELEPFFCRALALHREVLGPDDQATLRLIYGMGLAYSIHAEDRKAEPLIDKALARAQRVLGESHPQTAALWAVRAYLASQLNKLDKAEKAARRCLQMRESTLGEDHPLTVVAAMHLARAEVQRGELQQAAPLTERVLRLSRTMPAEDSPYWAGRLSALGRAYGDQGDIAKADELCSLAVQIVRRKTSGGAYRLYLQGVILNLGAVRVEQQRFQEAESLLRESLNQLERSFSGTGYPSYAKSLLGASLTGQGKFAEAEPFLLEGRRGLQQYQDTIPPCSDPLLKIRESFERLIRLYEAWGKPADAAEWSKKLAEFQRTHAADTEPGPQP